MKKILSILGTINLIGTSTTSLVACNTPQYSEKELADLKEKNNIKTKDGVLEWIAPQEMPFNKSDNKYYFVVWRYNENYDWKISNFKNEKDEIKIDVFKNINLEKGYFASGWKSLRIIKKSGNWTNIEYWHDDSKKNFKFVYSWNSEKDLPNLVVDSKTGEIKVEDE